MITLKAVQSDAAISELANLAAAIWNEYFPPIIGQGQVDYMVEKFQSEPAIRQQLAEGYRYFFIHDGEQVRGYLGIVPRPEGNALQISKLYLRREYRRQGTVRALMPQLCRLATGEGFVTLYLTVNKYNDDTIRAYERLGFINRGAIVADIGAGYVMDDYEMELPLEDARSC